MSTVTLIAILFSAAILLLIGRRDPKRLRAAASSSALAPHTPAQRRTLAALALVPGVLLALAAQSAGFVIWLGAVVALGWLLTQALASGSRDSRRDGAV